MVNVNYRLELTMEKFEPVLTRIQARLRVILSKNEAYMLSWNVGNLKDTGDDLIKLAEEVHSHLAEFEHRVLYYALRDAGLGIRTKVVEVQRRQLMEEDKNYFQGVHKVLKSIYEKIETGEYYRELLKIQSSRLAT